jgi:hypothetical protein
MTDERQQPRSFRAELAEVRGEAAISLGDPPTLAFSRPPYGFTRPLAREELGALAAGRFSADLDAQLRACAPPPLPLLGDADRARIVRLAGEAGIALTVGPATAAQESPAPTPTPEASTGRVGLWPAPPAPETIAPPGASTAAISPVDARQKLARTSRCGRMTLCAATVTAHVGHLPRRCAACGRTAHSESDVRGLCGSNCHLFFPPLTSGFPRLRWSEGVS